MSNLKNEFNTGVTKTVIELFKKVLQKAEQNAHKNTTQTGGMGPAPQMQQEQQEQQQQQQQQQQQEKEQVVGNVELTKAHQYYDATIYEGIIYEGNINGRETEISVDITDRTNGHLR